MNINPELFNIDEFYKSFYTNLLHIRKYFYELIKMLPDKDTNNNINARALLLEDLLEKMRKLLLSFSNKDRYIILMSKNLLNVANAKNNYLNLDININKNYNNLHFSLINNYYYFKLYNCMFRKQININNKFRIDLNNIYASFKSNSSINQNNKENNKEEEKEFMKTIYNYIGQKQYKHIFIIYKEKETIKEFNFEVKLINLSIIVLVNKADNIIFQCKVNEIYKPFSNSLLIQLINDELLDLVKRFSYRFRMKEMNFKEYILNFIEYIKDLDKIFYSKCEKCKKYSKYSFTQKAFLPPFIKYYYEKYGSLFLYNRSKEILFLHPQCI